MKKGGKTSVRYSDEVKAKAVAMWNKPGRTDSVQEIADSFGTTQQTVRTWVAAAAKAAKAAAKGKKTAAPANGSTVAAVKTSGDSLVELTSALRAHLDAVKTIKAKLRKLLDE